MQLRDYLETSGVDLAEFAATVGHSESAVKKWLRGERLPRRDALIKIKEATGGKVTSNDFLSFVAAQ